MQKVGNPCDTHEPCVMCDYPIRYHTVSRIVIDSPVTFLGGTSAEFPLLVNAKVPVHWPAPPEIIWLNRSLV